jgi:hypothetical protein
MFTAVGGPGGLSWYSDSLRAGQLGDRIAVYAKFTAPVQIGPTAHSAYCTVGTGSLSRGQSVQGLEFHPLPSSAEVKERVKMYLFSPSGPSWRVLGRKLLCLYFTSVRVGFMLLICSPAPKVNAHFCSTK